MDQFKVTHLYNLEETIAKDFMHSAEYPWQLLPGITDFIRKMGESLSTLAFDRVGPEVWVAKSATVAETATINGPCIIDEGAEVRHCAFIRGSVIVGKNAVVGNSTELKNVILFNGVQVPHYNYVGDSILGFQTHLGAGAITSNIKSDRTPVKIKAKGVEFETGLVKVGAMIGDNVEIGCNAVLNPGVIIGRNSIIYPLSMVRGFVHSDSIYKCKGEIANKWKE
jgi:NDP-sugar pyrophosphorylase family protein